MLDVAAFPDRLAEIRRRFPEADFAMVAEVVRAVASTIRGDAGLKEAALLAEVEELARTVAAARDEIAKLQPADINERHIPSASDELDAIVAHTAAATDSILECCEIMDNLAPSLPDAANQALQEVTTKIYEACSFQDITGQRITKVVATLKQIEQRVAHIIEVFQPAHAPRKAAATMAEPPASLTNGPQLPANAMGQNDIDALLASFD